MPQKKRNPKPKTPRQPKSQKRHPEREKLTPEQRHEIWDKKAQDIYGNEKYLEYSDGHLEKECVEAFEEFTSLVKEDFRDIITIKKKVDLPALIVQLTTEYWNEYKRTMESYEKNYGVFDHIVVVKKDHEIPVGAKFFYEKQKIYSLVRLGTKISGQTPSNCFNLAKAFFRACHLWFLYEFYMHRQHKRVQPAQGGSRLKSGMAANKPFVLQSNFAKQYRF